MFDGSIYYVLYLQILRFYLERQMCNNLIDIKKKTWSHFKLHKSQITFVLQSKMY